MDGARGRGRKGLDGGHSEEATAAFWTRRGVDPAGVVLGDSVGSTNLPIRRFWHEALSAQLQQARSAADERKVETALVKQDSVGDAHQAGVAGLPRSFAEVKPSGSVAAAAGQAPPAGDLVAFAARSNLPGLKRSVGLYGRHFL